MKSCGAFRRGHCLGESPPKYSHESSDPDCWNGFRAGEFLLIGRSGFKNRRHSNPLTIRLFWGF